MKKALQKIFTGQSLSREEARAACNQIMRGEASPIEIAGFLGALAAKGAIVEEIVGCAESLRENALGLHPLRSDLIDVCGTGGDGAETFNISTTNALLLAAAGLGVCKHGNRAVSSRCGSADVLEALGIKVDLSRERATEAIDQLGFAFLFAPLFHPALKQVTPVRQALGVRTIFNLLGPLVNPAPVKKQVLGVYAATLVEPMAQALLSLGSEDALVVWGHGGLDELSLSGPSLVARIHQGSIKIFELDPADFGLKRAPLNAIKGGDQQENAAHSLDVLRGGIGPRRDIVVMNAAAALVIAGRADSWRAGASLAEELIDSGQTLKILHKIRAFI